MQLFLVEFKLKKIVPVRDECWEVGPVRYLCSIKFKAFIKF